MYEQCHSKKHTGHGLFLQSSLYSIKLTANKIKALNNFKIIRSFGTLSYVAASYNGTRKNSKKNSTLIVIEGNKFYSKYPILYKTNGNSRYKLKMESKAIILNSEYLVDGLKVC